MRYRVTHRTSYTYDPRVTHGYNEARVVPRAFATQRIDHAEVRIEPAPDDRHDRVDAFGNHTVFFAHQRPIEHLDVTARSEVETFGSGQLSLAAALPWERARPAPHDVDRLYALDSPLVQRSDALAELAAGAFSPRRPLEDAAAELCTTVHRDFAYKPGTTTVSTSLEEVLAARRGVCQDFAHVLVGCLRSIGLAARYVSGYLETLPPPGQPRLVGADASHAWASLRLADGSWLDLDPTNDAFAPVDYVTVAWGRDYGDVPPLKGVVYATGAKTTLDVGVDVERIT